MCFHDFVIICNYNGVYNTFLYILYIMYVFVKSFTQSYSFLQAYYMLSMLDWSHAEREIKIVSGHDWESALKVYWNLNTIRYTPITPLIWLFMQFTLLLHYIYNSLVEIQVCIYPKSASSYNQDGINTLKHHAWSTLIWCCNDITLLFPCFLLRLMK